MSMLTPVSQVILPSAARTATNTTALIKNPGYKGVWFYLKVVSGATVTDYINLRVNIYDPVGGGYVQYTSFVNQTAAGDGRFVIYPGASSAGSASGNMDAPLPAEFNISVIHATAASVTYSLTAQWLP